ECWGECSAGKSCHMNSNHTCTCAFCGWSTPEQTECVGTCQVNGMECSQKSPTQQCTCGDQCVYDFASDRCMGDCVMGSCVLTSHEKCTCKH
ncbi:hypothetical protein KIPB_003745, partial [Kipferlia bialata]